MWVGHGFEGRIERADDVAVVFPPSGIIGQGVKCIEYDLAEVFKIKKENHRHHRLVVEA